MPYNHIYQQGLELPKNGVVAQEYDTIITGHRRFLFYGEEYSIPKGYQGSEDQKRLSSRKDGKIISLFINLKTGEVHRLPYSRRTLGK